MPLSFVRNMSETITHIEKKTTKVPELRFKEFDGEWKRSTLKKEAIVNPKSEKLPRTFIYIDLESVTKGILIKEEEIRIEEAPSRAQRLLRKDDILYQTVRPYQKNNYFFTKDGDYVASTGYAQIRAKGDPKYLFHFLHTSNFVNVVNRWSTGTSYPAISPSELVKISVAFPSLPEQQKIASFLSAVDEKIQQLTRKKELLEDYKKGVMQQIFSQQIRFKNENGNDFPEWEEVSMQDVFERVTQKNKEDNQNVLTISAQMGLVNQEEYFNRSVSAADLTGYYLLQKGDFAYNKSYSKGYPMGAIKRLDYYDKGVVSTLYICFRLKGHDDSDFYKEFLDHGGINHGLYKIVQEGARNHGLLNMSVVEFFRDIKIPRPCIEEQKVIGHFLNDLSNRIDQATEQLTQTQSFKTGLLQKMFV